jgi:hypothetical protein
MVPASGSSTSRAQRLPAPSLFVGPSSQNASSTSLMLPGPANTIGRPPLGRQRSLLSDRPRDEAIDRGDTAKTTMSSLNHRDNKLALAEKSSNDRTDAVWAEMQNTLDEVEINAASGNHMFGPNHVKALEQLRTAQIALAQAWARSEAEEESHAIKGAKLSSNNEDKLPRSANLLKPTQEDGRKPRSSNERSDADNQVQPPESAENDMELARKRREANDRYFQRVNAGVIDVVAKLEEVAKAMKGVEQESKEIWGENESMETRSIASDISEKGI